MNRNLRSFFCGAALAAFLIAPTVSGYGQTPPAPAPAPAPHVPAPPVPPHAPSNPGWAVAAVRSYNTSSLKLEDVVGTLVVAVRDTGPMTVEVHGAPERVRRVDISQDDGRLVIDGSSEEENEHSVWDWRNWFNFSGAENYNHGNLFIRVTVPRGASVNVDDLVGDVTIGDTMGDLRLDAAATKAHIGRVASAKISIGGSGRVEIASVANELQLDSGGSGKLYVGSAGSVRATLAGSGDAQFGPIAGGLHLDIAGSGDVTAARVNGPVTIEIAGSGNVKISDGIADPLRLDIMGAGNFYFGGVAVDPRIDAVGSGSVHIKAYRGHLSSEGMADVKIGD